MSLGSTQSLMEMSTRNLPGGKNRVAREADNLQPSVSRLSAKCEAVKFSHPYGPPWHVTGIALTPLFTMNLLNMYETLRGKKWYNYNRNSFYSSFYGAFGISC
jgi:hypothetical protein